MKSIVFATENPGKIKEIRHFAKHFGVQILSPSQAGLAPVDVDETGTTYEQNARLKVEAYRHQKGAEKLIICGDDTGVEITALGGEPGLHTRRWLGYRMLDDEIVGYALGRLHGVQDRSAVMRSTVAFSVHGGDIQVTTGELPGHLTQVPLKEAGEQLGTPFGKLFIIEDELSLPLWQFYRLPLDERDGLYSHREKAFLAMFEALSEAW